MLDIADRPCAKCGASDANYRDNNTSGFFCYDCFALSIKQKFRFALSKTKLFSNSWNSNKEPVRVLVLVERNARAEALLQLIDTVANEPEERRRFRLDTMVTTLNKNWFFNFFIQVYIVDSSRTEKLLNEQTTIGNFTASNVHLSAVLNSNDGPVEKVHFKAYSSYVCIHLFSWGSTMKSWLQCRQSRSNVSSGGWCLICWLGNWVLDWISILFWRQSILIQ